EGRALGQRAYQGQVVGAGAAECRAAFQALQRQVVGAQALQQIGGYFPQQFEVALVFGDVRPDMQLAREEIFGPVLAISAFDSEDEAIRLANDSRYGLAASLWSDDLHRAHRVARRLNAGTVSVNTVDALDVAVPFGGGKQSGFGRDLSLHSFDKYTQLKTTWFQLR
ncbi:aldehyde dehydrogenase family protein, partial [Pseudomonas aeruginosa]|nr:aldehyde dehydrogenase family protein [Pseudomonas aeruginosa]